MGSKIRQAQLDKVPYMLIVGDKEAADNTVSLRLRSGGDQTVMPFTGFKDIVKSAISSKSRSLEL